MIRKKHKKHNNVSEVSIAKNSWKAVGESVGITFECARQTYNRVLKRIISKVIEDSGIKNTNENRRKMFESEEFEEILCEACWAQWGSVK